MVFLFLAVSAINLPRVPQLVDYTVGGWAVGGALLLTALVLAISSYRAHTKASASRPGGV
ncbi:hypothetical protein ACT3UQ_15280 [Glutamicibacter sp. AOP12-B1-11]|uniref:hypothetical protein n=1 Tax=unclassified Arthrobacter TaxID=235627 RepID=UPI0011B0B9C6|nr:MULTISPECIES: hypothetical protein [unclassified Arthrobacter]